jgi:hypothetical protein
MIGLLFNVIVAAPEVATNVLSDSGNLLQAAAIIVGFLGVAATIFYTSVIAGKRATFDLILSELLDPRQVELRGKFTTLRDAGNLEVYASSPKAESDEASVIVANLNIYEMIAVGISKKIIDEQSYKRWARTALVKDWQECKAYVTVLRKEADVPTYYCEFEKLARKWAVAAEKRHC